MPEEEKMDQVKQESGGSEAPDAAPSGARGFLSKHGPAIGLAVLVGYVILLGIGVFAEIFKIQWILDWWIWSPPGKFK